MDVRCLTWRASPACVTANATSTVEPAMIMTTRDPTDWPPHVAVRQLMLHATPHRAQAINACKTFGEQLVELPRRSGYGMLCRGNDKFDPLMIEAVSTAMQCFYFKVPIRAKHIERLQRTAAAFCLTVPPLAWTQVPQASRPRRRHRAAPLVQLCRKTCQKPQFDTKSHSRRFSASTASLPTFKCVVFEMCTEMRNVFLAVL